VLDEISARYDALDEKIKEKMRLILIFFASFAFLIPKPKHKYVYLLNTSFSTIVLKKVSDGS